jgi:hypothetical protein
MDAGSARASSVGDDTPPPHDLLKAIDKDLPAVMPVSLEEWGNIWLDLGATRDLCRRDLFALTGHFTDPETGVTRRSTIDFSRHKIRADDHISQVCDIDSMIGIVLDEFPIRPAVTLKYFMLASAVHTLNSNLHIPPVTVPDENGSEMVSARDPCRYVNSTAVQDGVPPQNTQRSFRRNGRPCNHSHLFSPSGSAGG